MYVWLHKHFSEKVWIFLASLRLAYDCQNKALILLPFSQPSFFVSSFIFSFLHSCFHFNSLHSHVKFAPSRHQTAWPRCCETDSGETKWKHMKQEEKRFRVYMTDFNRNTNPQIQPQEMQYSLHFTITAIYRRSASLLWVLLFRVLFYSSGVGEW